MLGNFFKQKREAPYFRDMAQVINSPMQENYKTSVIHYADKDEYNYEVLPSRGGNKKKPLVQSSNLTQAV